MTTLPTKNHRGRGRPPAYKADYAKQALALCKLGAIDRDLSEALGVNLSTISAWRLSYPDFAEACALGKAQSDDRVESSLFQRAVGYSFDSEKIVTTKDAVHRVPVVEHVPPDVTAARHWLANRRPDKWKLQPEARVKLPVSTDGSAASLTAVLVETLNAVVSGRISHHEGERIAALIQVTGDSSIGWRLRSDWRPWNNLNRGS